MKWSVISAVNNEDVAKRCLLSSPGILNASEILLQRNFLSAAAAYNAGIDKATSDYLVFVHQDVFLPEGWFCDVQDALEILSRTDRNWAVLGCCGIGLSGEYAGYVYDGAWRSVLGGKFQGGVEVETLDEIVLVLRKSTGLRFDPQLADFHMYGADICLEARRLGKKCYAIAAFCIHNTNQYRMLPWEFWKSYLWIRKKWRSRLPVRTTCIKITPWCWPMLRWNLVRFINLSIGRDKPPVRRVEDPGQLYRELVCAGTIAPLVGSR